VFCFELPQAELKTDMHAGLTAADRRELAQLQPALEGLTKDLAAAKKARNQVRTLLTVADEQL
jgi:hypothetical protein